jgi:hypothetical protein
MGRHRGLLGRAAQARTRVFTVNRGDSRINKEKEEMATYSFVLASDPDPTTNDGIPRCDRAIERWTRNYGEGWRCPHARFLGDIESGDGDKAWSIASVFEIESTDRHGVYREIWVDFEYGPGWVQLGCSWDIEQLGALRLVEPLVADIEQQRVEQAIERTKAAQETPTLTNASQ